jgi:hypothetical protein
MDKSWNGKVFVYLGEERAPSAVRALSDYSELDMNALDQTAHLQLMANATVVHDRDRLGLKFGHPLLHREDGARVFGCEVRDHSGMYNQIELSFVAEGVSSSSAPPQMTIVTKCHSVEDLNQLETIWIPMKRIYSLPSRDQEFKANDDTSMTIQFTDMAPEWPDQWVLTGVRLLRDESEGLTTGTDEAAHSLSISTDQLRDAQAKLLSLDWKNPTSYQTTPSVQ